MATKTKETKNSKNAPAAEPMELPTATATSVDAAPAVAPPAEKLAAARTSSAQATLWHSTVGSTMPPPSLRLLAGCAPKGKEGGPRHQHGTVQHAAVAALGSTATVATVAAWIKEHGAKVPGCGQHGAQAGASGNIRFALSAGVLTAWA